MSKANRYRPYRVGPQRGRKFPDRFRHRQGLIKRVWLEVYDEELNRFLLVPAVPGSTIVAPENSEELY